MATKRKASAYSKRKPVVNTRRSRKQQFSYVKTVPPHKIVRFNMGDAAGFQAGKYPLTVKIVTEDPIQIRDFALEAIRQSLNKDLAKIFTNRTYFLQCKVYPHNILRNNRIFSGGSKGERVQTGMKQSFGSPEGRSATLKKGQTLFIVHFAGKEHLPKIKASFVKVKPKIASKARIISRIV